MRRACGPRAADVEFDALDPGYSATDRARGNLRLAVQLGLPAVYLGPGLAVWLLARGASHLGSSGLVYGLASYVFVAGLLRRDRRAIGASMLVCFLYGAMWWGVLPIEPGVSWETHLA